MRLEPIFDKVSDANNKKINVAYCPQCGNQVNRHRHKFHCQYCHQALAWPGIQYKSSAEKEIKSNDE